MQQGKTFALVSDAGAPLISDPGFLLVREMIATGLEFTYIPGPSAVIAALVLSGLPTSPFTFCGFLPIATAARTAHLQQLAAQESHTFVLFESPERVLSLLREIGETMGDREVAVCRELTKLHEEVWRGRCSEVLTHAAAKKIQGEFTVVIAPGKAERTPMSDDAIRARYAHLLAEGQSRKDILKKLSKETGRSRNDLYDLLIK